MSKSMIIHNEEEMLAFGAALSRDLPLGLVIYLHGDLGAGKTTLVRGVLRGLGYQNKVKSPTYTLVEPYELARGMFYHFDLYRLQDPAELSFMGIEEYFSPTTITFIEWPQNGKGLLAPADLDLHIDFKVEARSIQLIANTEKGQKILATLHYKD